LRNSLNVALPVTANFIDPIPTALVQPGKDCGIRRQFYGCERATASYELTLPAEWLGRQLQLFSMLRRDGVVNGAKQSDQLSGGCSSPQEAALPGYGNNKVLYLLIFLA
jgi:hypothetical protein